MLFVEFSFTSDPPVLLGNALSQHSLSIKKQIEKFHFQRKIGAK